MEKFINSGRIMWRETYLKKNQTAQLLNECNYVVEYSDGSFIQLLNSGVFYVDSTFKSLSLDEAEVFLWEKINKKLNDV